MGNNGHGDLYSQVLGGVMILFKLDGSFLPSTTIPKFETLAWTERYQTAGDFKLVVVDDISILDTLPLGTLISHTDTWQVMIVEDHQIARDKDQKLNVTVTGRTFETFAENRYTPNCESYLNDSVGLLTDTAQNICDYILRYSLTTAGAPAGNGISNVAIVKAMRDPDVSLTYPVHRSDTYSAIMEILKMAGGGLRNDRPHDAQTTLNVVLHDGQDLTGTVVFYAQKNDLEDTQYLWSLKTFKNYAQVTGPTCQRLVKSRNEPISVTGLNRRIIYVESTELEGTFLPPSDTDALATMAQIAIDGKPKISLVEAKISKTAKPRYKFNYDIGDLVMVHGEFLDSQAMRVTQHILTVDKTGIQGLPSLTIL